jgi:hypothetical protein
MGQLGLKRRARPAPTLRDYLAEKGAAGTKPQQDEGHDDGNREDLTHMTTLNKKDL